jgi:hypothetical protein
MLCLFLLPAAVIQLSSATHAWHHSLQAIHQSPVYELLAFHIITPCHPNLGRRRDAIFYFRNARLPALRKKFDLHARDHAFNAALTL